MEIYILFYFSNLCVEMAEEGGLLMKKESQNAKQKWRYRTSRIKPVSQYIIAIAEHFYVHILIDI